MKKFLVLFILCSGIFSINHTEAQNPRFVYLLDVSRSMERLEVEVDGKKMKVRDIVLDYLVGDIKRIDPKNNTEVVVVPFNDNELVASEMHYVIDDNTNFDNVANEICSKSKDLISAHKGFTNIAGALQYVLSKHITGSRYTKVMLLTDGEQEVDEVGNKGQKYYDKDGTVTRNTVPAGALPYLQKILQKWEPLYHDNNANKLIYVMTHGNAPDPGVEISGMVKMRSDEWAQNPIIYDLFPIKSANMSDKDSGCIIAVSSAQNAKEEMPTIEIKATGRSADGLISVDQVVAWDGLNQTINVIPKYNKEAIRNSTANEWIIPINFNINNKVELREAGYMVEIADTQTSLKITKLPVPKLRITIK